jgi:ElaB/YqjD/DUF883 family membrane-anchored ribosome-binding protein
MATSDSAGALEKAKTISEKANNWISDIRTRVDEFQARMQEYVDEANAVINNAANNSQKYINAQLTKIQTKLNAYYDSAMKWITDQLAKLKDWINKQVQKIQKQIKETTGRLAASTQEAATGVEVPDSVVEKLSAAVPDVVIPVPDVPEITLKKLEINQLT